MVKRLKMVPPMAQKLAMALKMVEEMFKKLIKCANLKSFLK